QVVEELHVQLVVLHDHYCLRHLSRRATRAPSPVRIGHASADLLRKRKQGVWALARRAFFSEWPPEGAFIFPMLAAPRDLIGVRPFLVRAIENIFDRWRQTVRMTEEDLKTLRAAAAMLEHPGLAARLGN